MLTIKEITVPGYKRVIEAINKEAGLHSFIAIHDLTLGPSLGGTRIFPYKSRDEALNDVLRLAKGMTYKSAIAQTGLGGGKSVIIANPSKEKTQDLLMAFGDVVQQLQGQYIAAEDVGSSPEDMVVIHNRTPFVVGLPTDNSSGNPSHYTAWGVFRGMQAIAKKLWKGRSLKGKTVAIQGLGSVGTHLGAFLFWEGANLVIADINPQHAHDFAHTYGAKVVKPDEIYSVDCDIFSPCALGGILNETTIPQLKCKAVAGSANNQLGIDKHGDLLMQRGILYAPDYIINSGGLINVTCELDPHGYDPKVSRDHVNHIYDRVLEILDKSEKENKTTNQVADQLAEYNLQHKVGLREKPIACFKR